MTDTQEAWKKGYMEGWEEQGVYPTSEPIIPPMPNIPDGVSNSEEWAHKEGKSLGVIDRIRSQAGLS